MLPPSSATPTALRLHTMATLMYTARLDEECR